MSVSRFSSCLAAQMDRFINLRRLSGTDYHSQTRLLECFDRFLTQQSFNRPPITREITDSYQQSLTRLAPRSRSNRMCVIRQFCQYLAGSDPQSYVPGPLQMISAVFIAVVLRVNLPVAAFTTLYTNPFTILPLYALAYEIGAWVSGVHNGVARAKLSFPEMHWHDWMGKLWDWMMALGEPIMIGLPLLALGLSIIGYVLVRGAWRVMVILKWRARQRRRTV